MASFDENGKYIKTNWKAGDKITATKLNKIEESIEAVNDNDISRHVEADARLDALEAKDATHDKELTNVKNLIADNKAAAELGDYEINSRMTFLEQELNEGIEEVNNVAETVDGKIAQGKADMEAMVAEVEADLEGLHAKDEELSEQLADIENNKAIKTKVYIDDYIDLVVDDDWTGAIMQAYDDIKNIGGTIVFNNSYVYKVNGKIIDGSSTKKIFFEGNNATIKQTSNESTTTIYYNDLMIFNNLNLEGNVVSGYGYTDVAPSSCYGFRSTSNSKGDCIFNNCIVSNFSYDGWYHNSEHSTLILNNCSGFNCYRNDVTIIQGSSIINGGEYGNDTLNLDKVASIDVEPNENCIVHHVDINNVTTYGLLQIIASTGGSYIYRTKINNLKLNNELNKSYLKTSRITDLSIDNIIKIGSPTIQINHNASNRTKGFYSIKNAQPLSKNLIDTQDGTYSEWSNHNNAGTKTSSTIGMFDGVRLETVSSTGYRNIRTTVEVKPDTLYTMGCYMKATLLAGAKHGMFAKVGEEYYTVQPDVNDEAQWICCTFDTPSDITEIEISIGGTSSNQIDLTFAKPFLFEGYINSDVLNFI